MGFWSNIKDKIFGAPHPAATAAAPTKAAPAPTPIPTAAPAAPTATTAAAPIPGAPPPPATPANVDVAAILDAAVAKHGQKLNWRTSIVDLMKALDIDSSLHARQELAKELGYKGSSDSAAMNIWLHKQVIQKLKDHGGTVPPELLD